MRKVNISILYHSAGDEIINKRTRAERRRDFTHVIYIYSIAHDVINVGTLCTYQCHPVPPPVRAMPGLGGDLTIFDRRAMRR